MAFLEAIRTKYAAARFIEERRFRPEAALDALRQAAGQRMEDRMVSEGEDGPARGFGGVKRLVGSLMDSLNEARARRADLTVRLEQA